MIYVNRRGSMVLFNGTIVIDSERRSMVILIGKFTFITSSHGFTFDSPWLEGYYKRPRES
jgi:hypothetical protein